MSHEAQERYGDATRPTAARLPAVHRPLTGVALPVSGLAALLLHRASTTEIGIVSATIIACGSCVLALRAFPDAAAALPARGGHRMALEAEAAT